jgi:hypothetical protein
MPSVLTIVVIFMLLNVNRLIDENILIKAVTDEIIIDKSDLHGFVVDTRNLLIDKYIQEPKSQEQLNVWMKTRGILRQSSAETLNGKITRCGENSRLMINVFRNLGIKAKRLYFYGDIGTSHVLFEYFDEKENKWYVMNSFNDQVEFTFLNSVVDHNKVTKEDLFSHYDVKDTIYYEASNLNFQLKNVFGANTEIPYFLSYLMDEIFLLKIIILLFILLSLLAINFWIKKRIENE